MEPSPRNNAKIRRAERNYCPDGAGPRHSSDGASGTGNVVRLSTDGARGGGSLAQRVSSDGASGGGGVVKESYMRNLWYRPCAWSPTTAAPVANPDEPLWYLGGGWDWELASPSFEEPTSLANADAATRSPKVMKFHEEMAVFEMAVEAAGELQA